MTTPLEKHVDGKEAVLPNDTMSVAELYAEGIVDLSLKLQKGGGRSASSLLTDEGNDVTVTAVHMRDSDTKNC